MLPAKSPAKVKTPAVDETPVDSPTLTIPAEVQVLVPTEAEGHTLHGEIKIPAACAPASVQRSCQRSARVPASAPASIQSGVQPVPVVQPGFVPTRVPASV